MPNNTPLFLSPVTVAHGIAARVPLVNSNNIRQTRIRRHVPNHHVRPVVPLRICIKCGSETPTPPSSSSSSSSSKLSGDSNKDSNGSNQRSEISISTAVSSAPTLNDALAEVASRSLANLSPGGPPNLALIYVSVRYSVTKVGQSGRHSMDLVVPRLRALLPSLTAVVGSTVDGVMGMGPLGETVEVENTPAVSLTLLRLPRVSITPFHVMPDDLPSPDALQNAWHTAISSSTKKIDPKAFLLLSDPTFAARGELDRFLSGLAYAFPNATVAGALASAGTTYANGHLFCTLPRDILSPDATSLRDSGCVGVALSGDVELDCLLSPGGRGIGPEMEVRKVDINGGNGSSSCTILELEIVGRPSTCLPATGHLKSVISYATPAERRLLQDRLQMGFVVQNGLEESVQMRYVIGVDLIPGGITIAAQDVRVGQRVRFFVLDTQTAVESLDKSVQRYKRVELANSLVGYSNPPVGAIVFADVARGRDPGAATNIAFRDPRMETTALSSVAKGLPIAGAFSGGQIGPHSTDDPDGRKSGTPAILHTAANLILLVRKLGGMTASTEDSENPDVAVDARSMSSDLEQTEESK